MQQAPGKGEVVDLVDSDSDEEGLQAMPAAAASVASAGVLDLIDDDDDDDVVIFLGGTPATNANKRRKGNVKGKARAPASAATASAMIHVSDDDDDDDAWGGAAAAEDDEWRMQLPPENCEECGMQDHVVRLSGCGHGVCLFCLRRPYEDLVVTSTSDDPLLVLRCPVSACGRSLLAAADALHLLAPADFDAYAKQRLKAFKAQIDAGSGGSSRKKAVVPCPSCNRTPRVPKQGGGGGEDVSVVGSKRKREESAGGGGKPAAWEKALEAAEPPSPLVLECKGGCNLLYCQLCRTSLAPAGAHRAWGARHEQEGDRAGCACLPLQRLVALEAATAAMLEEMQRERKGTGRAAAKKPQAAARPAASAAAAAQKGKWAAGTGFGGSSSGSSSGYGDLDGAFDGDWESHGSYEDHSDEDDDAGHDDRYTKFWQKKKKEAQPSKAEVAAKERQEKEDAAIRSLLGRWRQALPKGPMQAPILPETQHLLARAFSKDHGAVSSPLLQLLRMLLLNDSVMDTTARSEVYQAALDVVQALVAHPLVAPMLERAIDDEAEEEDEGAAAAGGGKKPVGSGGGGGGGGGDSSSLLAMLGRLHAQAAFHVKCGGKAMGEEIASQEEEALFQDLTLSTKVIDTHDAVTRTLEQHRQAYFLELQAFHQVMGKLGHAEGHSEEEGKAQGGKGKGKGEGKTPRVSAAAKAAQEDAETEEAYKRELGALRLESVLLLAMCAEKKLSHSFATTANQGAGPTGAINRIMREVTTLQNSLPVEHGAGIWIRVDEDKPHVMKALISGPMDTPYAQGLFEFDILLPANYPNSPPKVQLVTTGGNQFRFNPNLYACGKVCLSLLGTWSGPGWEPGKSTLLQVLISIQSLIMVPQPMFNEPGYERELNTPSGTQKSNQYDAVIRRGTLQYAVLQQLQRPSPVFQDVIKKHFHLRRRQVMAQCDAWLAQEPSWFKGAGSSHGAGGGPAIDMAATVRTIKALLEGKAPPAAPPAPPGAVVGAVATAVSALKKV